MPVNRDTSKSRLARTLDALEKHHGPARVPEAARPYELLVFANCGYPASERACTAGFSALKASVGTSPEAILGARKSRLVEAMRAGGIVPEVRAERLREIAEKSSSEGGDPDAVLRMPLARARKYLKTFPTIGDPGADKILLLSRVAPIAAVPSNATQVPLRLGFGKEQSSYASSYRSAQAALDADLPRDFEARIRAYLLLKKHGEEVCKRSHPMCERCPLATECPYAKGSSRRRA
jgi:endonuclease III